MEFMALNAAVAELRNTLGSFTGEELISQITIMPPSNDSDEASFLRLVNWSYVLLFESGRVAIPYLLKLRGGVSVEEKDIHSARLLVHSLRTWNSHNIGFSTDRDQTIGRQVYRWFAQHGGVPRPDDADLWRRCFQGLCFEVGAIMEHCQNAVMLALSDRDDGEDFIADLQRRSGRNWPVHRFDEIVTDACARFSVKLDVPKFRNPRLSKWREFLETIHEDDDPQRWVIAIIERDILDYTNNILPINGSDVMSALTLDPGPEVGDALRRARELSRSGIHSPEELLDRLKDEQARASE